MSRTTRQLLFGLLVTAAAVALIYLFQEHRATVAHDRDDEEPAATPSRVRDVNGETLVVLDSEDLRRIGLRTAVLRASSELATRRLPGEVVAEPERVASVRAPLSGRMTVPSGAAWPAFGDHVSAGTVVAQVSDAKPLSVPIAGTVTRIEARPGELVAAGQLLIEITDYSQPVVRIAWPNNAGDDPPQRLRLQPLGTSSWIGASRLGAASEADPVSRFPAFLYRAERGWLGARPGAPVVVMLERGRRTEGVFIPDSAVVQWEGLVWVYVQKRPGQFRRARVSTDHPARNGWIVGPPLGPGDTVVVVGAEQLLSEEFRARITVGEEVGE